MSKKRKVSSSSATLVKVEIKEENIYNDDVLLARGRLKGVLQELVEQSDEESASSEDERKRYRGRQSKRKDVLSDGAVTPVKLKKRRSPDGDASPLLAAPVATPVGFHHTYVMKLFDRSVDLARFEEDTPLYPICRAWMANQPRANAHFKFQTLMNNESTNELGKRSTKWNNSSGEHDVQELPEPRGEPLPRVPEPLAEQRSRAVDSLEKALSEDAAGLRPSRDELIRTHLLRWTRVKHHWIQRANSNELRFQDSFDVLTAIYNKAQENME